jgi:two-component system, LytTR family, sensor kinase
MRISKYWLCQIIGWGAFGFYDSLVNFLSGRILQQEIPYTLSLLAVGIIITHLYRVQFIKKYNWTNLKIKSLLPKLFLSIILKSVILAAFICFAAFKIQNERAVFHFYFFLVFFLTMLLLVISWNLIYFIWKYITDNEWK